MKLELFKLRRIPPIWVKGILGFACIGLVLGIWTLVTRGQAEYRIVSPDQVPSPGETFSQLDDLYARDLMASIAASLKRVFTGFGLAILVGVPLGMLAGTWRAVHAFFAPIIIFGRNVPIAALIPLTLIWFKMGETQKFMFIFIACVPFVFSDSVTAISAVHQRYVETAQTLGANSWQVFRKVLVPLSLPEIYLGLRHLFGLAFGYIMLAEVIDADHGLGHLIEISRHRSLWTHIYLILFIIALLAFAIDKTLAFFQRGLFPYRKDL